MNAMLILSHGWYVVMRCEESERVYLDSKMRSTQYLTYEPHQWIGHQELPLLCLPLSIEKS